MASLALFCHERLDILCTTQARENCNKHCNQNWQTNFEVKGTTTTTTTFKLNKQHNICRLTCLLLATKSTLLWLLLLLLQLLSRQKAKVCRSLASRFAVFNFHSCCCCLRLIMTRVSGYQHQTTTTIDSNHIPTKQTNCHARLVSQVMSFECQSVSLASAHIVYCT